MLEEGKLKVYTASAGSGKTHTIVYEYLKLALENNHTFAKILAVTFTNKVAREMKQRIIDTIYNISNAKYDAIAQELLIVKQWSPNELTKRAKLLLSTILHSYSQFTICTIDSFFQQVIGSFDIALGLYSGFSLELDSAKAIDTATKSTIDHIASNTSLKKWILQLAVDKLYQEKNWNPKTDIATLCNTFFAESQHFSTAKIDSGYIDVFLQSLNDTISHFEAKLQAYGRQAMAAMQSRGLKTDHFAYGKSGVMGYLEKLSNLEIEEPTKRTISALDNPAGWYAKNSQNRDSISSLLEDGLMHTLQDIFFFYGKNALIYKSAKAAKRFLYMVGIRSQVECALDTYKRKNDIIFISDAAALTHAVISKYGVKGFIDRLGQAYSHIFIDEFQDISSLQWGCFKPLILAGIENNSSSIVVGDVKQSIYRWRNSDWKLLHSQIFNDIESHKTLNLDTNWRSKQNIVFFNNTFFSLASSLLAEHLIADIEKLENLKLRSSLVAQANSVVDIYKNVAQCVPPSKDLLDAGYVKIKFISDGDDGTEASWQELAIQQTVDTIEILQEEGVPPSEIAILVRNHKEGRQILEAIAGRGEAATAKPHCIYEAVSTSSFYLGHNRWVNLIISAMKHMSHRDNKLYEYELRFFYNLCLEGQIASSCPPPCLSRESANPVGQKISLSTETKHCFTVPVSTEITPLAWERQGGGIFDMDVERLKKIQNLHHLPLNSIVDALVDLFAITDDSATPFLQKLSDLVLEFSSNKESSLDSFLEWWGQKGNIQVLPGAEGMNAIKILTIHQSKGLQFDAVIIPFCSWAFDHSPTHAPMLWCKDGDTDIFSAMPALPMLYSPKLKDTVFSKSYYAEHLQTHLDNLNLLYVALTRSKDSLYIFSNKSSAEGIKSTSDLLSATLSQHNLPKGDYFFTSWQLFWNSQGNALEIGTRVSTKSSGLIPLSLCHSRGSEKPVKQKNALFCSNEYSSLDPNFHQKDRGAKLPFEHKQINENANVWTTLFQKSDLTTDPLKAQLGDIVHELLSRIFTLADVPKIIDEIVFLPTSPENRTYIKAIFMSCVKNEQIKNWFNGDWQHHIEATLMNKNGKILRPDRVLLRAGRGIVIDFKTGNKKPFHKQQVQEYAEAIVDMGYGSVEGYLVYLYGASIEIEQSIASASDLPRINLKGNPTPAIPVQTGIQ